RKPLGALDDSRPVKGLLPAAIVRAWMVARRHEQLSAEKNWHFTCTGAPYRSSRSEDGDVTSPRGGSRWPKPPSVVRSKHWCEVREERRFNCASTAPTTRY